jgi:hypothetical protein
MNKTLRTKSSNNRIVILLMIIGLFALFMSGCGQPVEPVKNATNAAPTNAAPSANSAAPKANTNSEVSKASESTPGGACSGEPTDYEVFLYTEKDYQGSCAKISAAKTGTEGRYDAGVYRNPAALGITNDTTVSIKMGKKVRAILCKDDDFKDFCVTQPVSTGFLTAGTNPNVPQLDKMISSVIVMPNGEGATLTVANNSDKNLAAFEKIQGVGYAFDSYLGNLGSKASSKYVSYQGITVGFQEYSAERKMFISQVGYRIASAGDKTIKIENGGGNPTNIQVVE